MSGVAEPIILVTGASRGLGRQAALRLGARGARIVAVARTVGGLEELDDDIKRAGGPAAVLAPFDIDDGEAVDRLGGALFERFGRLDGWIHAAAEGASLAPVDNATPKDVARLMAVNGLAVQRLIRSMHPLLAAGAQPRALFLTDDKLGRPLMSAYALSKAAGEGFARAYAAEQKRVAVGFFEPKPCPTALRARSHPGEDRAKLADIREEAARILAAFDALGAVSQASSAAGAAR